MPTFQETIRQIFPDVVILEQVEGDDRRASWAKQATAIEQTYTYIVDAFRRHPNPLLARLARNLWDLVHYRHVHTAVTSNVSGLIFAVMRKNKQLLPTFMMPYGWSDQFKEQPSFIAGAVLFTGCRAVDYYNGRMDVDPPHTLNARGASYEAEFLRGLVNPTLNEYQREVLRLYPQGYEPRFDYELRGVSSDVS